MQQKTAPSSSPLADAQCIVIKVGTALVFDEYKREPRTAWMAALAQDVMHLRDQGKDVTLVSSGAIALGRMKLGETKPKAEMTVAEKQAMAAVGQQELMKLWDEAFKPHGIAAAQLLLTKNDFKNGKVADMKRQFKDYARKILPRLFPEEENPKANIKHTIAALHGRKTVAIVNENDATATDEIKFGDNDRLGALVAKLVKAQSYIILSDINGLYTGNPQKDPKAQHIAVVDRIDDKIRSMATGPVSAGSSGGMISKVQAAEIATKADCATIICHGNPKDATGATLPPISALVAGGQHTVFLAANAPIRPMNDHALVRKLSGQSHSYH
jgi:glutamate 5-kinase